MKVFFWQHMPSHIQSPALKSFAEYWPDDVFGVWSGGISPDRIELGWCSPEFGSLKEIVLPRQYKETASKLILDNLDQVHIFSGINAYRSIDFARTVAQKNNAPNVCLMVEPGIRMGWKGIIRPLRARWICKNIVPHARLVLAMGKDGEKFYRNAGFPANTIFPYMYQSEASPVIQVKRPISDIVKIVYVGKFIPRKGVDLMLRGLAKCKNRNWQLDIIGTGPEQPMLEELSKKLKINSQIQWLGRLPSSHVSPALSQYDLCMVPSRFEGWGVLVNEAIQAGIGVICSDRVTSRELVQKSKAGFIYAGLSTSKLGKSLDEILIAPERILEFKQRARSYAPLISGKSVSSYLADVLKFVSHAETTRPQPPWLAIDTSD